MPHFKVLDDLILFKGMNKTLKRLSANFYWSNMAKDVRSFISQCRVCQQTKYSTKRPGGLLVPLPIPSHVWEDISMDFITGLPLSHGYTVIFVVVDRFSKVVHLGALPSSFTAYKVAELFVSMFCKHHGLPKSIVSDRDLIFMSRFWSDLFKFSGTLLRMSSSYHPQFDGQTEVMNSTIEQYLRAFVHETPQHWFKFLPWAEFHYNTSVHSGSELPPFQIIFGKPPPSIPEYLAGTSQVASCDSLLSSREDVISLLRQNLLKAQKRMKKNEDLKRRELSFEVGSWVYVKLQPYRQSSVSGAKFHKLFKRFYGPYRILEKMGPAAYKLDLPATSKIHNVFHYSVLKAHVGVPPTTIDSLPPDSYANHPLVTPLTVLGFKTAMVNGVPTRMALV